MTKPDQTTEKPDTSLPRIDILVAVFLVIFSFSIFHVNPYVASNLSITPDSQEYAIAAHNIVTDHAYFITVGGERIPPRYPPWFSLLFLAPSYLLFGKEIGNAIYPVTFMAIIGVLAAFGIGRRVSGLWGGLLAALSILASPYYRGFAGEIMTEIPCIAMLLLACLLHLRIKSDRDDTLWLYPIAGTACAVCGAIRPVLMSAILPFLFDCLNPSSRMKKRFTRLALLSIPVAIAVTATMGYNSVTFNSPLRNGYNYWCAVPFDYSSLCFSVVYLGRNLETILLSPLPALIVAALLIHLLNTRFPVLTHGGTTTDHASLRHLAWFTVITCIPSIAVHLVYFYQATRFYLPAMCLLAVIVASMVGKWFKNIPNIYAVTTQGILAAVAAVIAFNAPELKPPCRMLADQLAANTASNAIIISSIEPAYLEFFLTRSNQRRIIPLSRNVEYASKVVCPLRIENPFPPPRSAFDHRCEGLLNGGAREVIPVTADEGLDMLSEELKKGTPVILDASLVTTNDVHVINLLQKRFGVTHHGGCIYGLSLKPAQ